MANLRVSSSLRIIRPASGGVVIEVAIDGAPVSARAVRVDFALEVTASDGTPVDYFALDLPTVPGKFFGDGVRAIGVVRGAPPVTQVFNFKITAVVTAPGDVVSGSPVVIEFADRVAAGGLQGARLYWSQARWLAQTHGIKIRREGWQDRYLIYESSLWWMQLYHPGTKASTTIAPVTSSQWSKDDFRATDWAAHGAIDATLLAAAREITARFP